ncbi:MAG: penicillin-binding transpeptidase domain-containing protein [Acidobacteriota bacterium]|nr:penicillin-binding transpeptidase domain-containing protein [Acidobacteriota bacterium]
MSVVFVISVFLSASTQAQKRKPTAEKKKSQASSQTTSKSANKTTDKKSSAKQIAEKQTSSKNDKNAKDKNATTAKSRQAEVRNRAEEKRQAEIRRAEEARRREIEEARRQAALAEQRRREQAAREARERAIAFERGLRTETVQNIANDNTEGEDLEVRRAAITALGNKAGMVVVMEPQTGKVLSIVNQDWAVRKAYKPCSTIKLVTAIAGLNENVIDGYDGSITTRRFPMDLNDALAFSNNKYFQTVGASLGNKKMLAYAQMLGLGRPTGINADEETGGRLPFGNSNAKVYSHGEDFEVSPVQLAVLVSTISNGGKIVVPQIPRTKFEQTNFRMTTRGTVNLPLQDLQGVVPGMIGAASYGTARHGVDSSMGVAGKTGSCIGQGSWLGLFASVAPVANPKLAVVVITRGQAERGKYAAAVAGKIYQALSYRLREKGAQPFVAQTPTVLKPLTVKPQPKVDAKTAALLDDADEDGGDAEVDNDALLSKGKKGGADNNAKPEAIQKPERKIEKPTTTFAPVVITVKREKQSATRPRVVSHE